MTLEEAKNAATHALDCMMDYGASADVSKALDKARDLLRNAVPLAGPNSAEGRQWMLDVREALYIPHNTSKKENGK